MVCNIRAERLIAILAWHATLGKPRLATNHTRMRNESLSTFILQYTISAPCIFSLPPHLNLISTLKIYYLLYVFGAWPTSVSVLLYHSFSII